MNNKASVEPGRASLDWLLDGLINRVPGSERAVVLSADGLAVGRSSGLSREDAEHLAAIASALHSLARGVGSRFDKGKLRQTVIELAGGYLIVTEAGQGACLAVLTKVDAELGLVAYEMNVIVGQVRDQLTAMPRTAQGARPPYMQ